MRPNTANDGAFHTLAAVLGSTLPTDGAVVLNLDGEFTYTPDAGFVGIDTFTYVANDGTVDSNEATVTITVNPVDPPQISITDVSKREGRDGKTATFTFTATRSGDTSSAITIDYATIDGTATVADGDYAYTSGWLAFGVGETTKTISVTVYGDSVAEYNETFGVRLTDQYDNRIVGTGTIINDDKGTPAGSASATDAALMSLFAAADEEEDLLAQPADDLDPLLV